MAALPRTLRRPALAALSALVPVALGAQETARVRVDENFRQVPNGTILAELEAGTPLSVLARDGAWVEVGVEGWVWTRSLQIANREGLDLVVSVPDGENLRAEPSGQVLGRLVQGTLLQELERRPGWIRVRRQGWIWGGSLVESAGGARTATRPAAETPRTSPPGAVARRPEGFTVAGASGAAILSAPDGDTLAAAAPRAELQVLSRQGSWVRVRIEGWTWQPATDVDGAAADAAGAAGAALTPGDLTAAPDAHRGRVVTWTLQFISLERAERVRTDFFEGEPFLLTRFGGASGPFVYVALPPEQAGELSGLVPLETLDVTGRVRTGASSLTGTPILDLVSFTRARPPR